MNHSSGKPAVFAKFLGTEILGEQGRLMFALLNAFASSGYPVLLLDNIPVEKLGKYGLRARTLNGLTLTTAVPEGSSAMFYLFDIEDKGISKRKWRRQIEVRFDIFSPYWLGRPILMPYPVHPVHTAPNLEERLAGLRATPRRLRIFFSGETAGYTRNRVTYPAVKLPRHEIIQTVLARMGDNAIFVQDQPTFDRLLAAGHLRKCVIMDTSKVRIADENWLGVLSAADFFLAPPGIVMPMCHNAIEALAVGAVPIINYAEWFDPALEHGRDCIAFDNKDALINSLNSALAMDEAEITELRAGALAYYDTHLTNRSFLASLDARRGHRIQVLMIAEAYVGRNASRLNGRSFLMRRAPNGGIMDRLSKLAGR